MKKAKSRKAGNGRVGRVSPQGVTRHSSRVGRVGRVSPQGVTRHSRGGDGDNRTHSLRTRTNSSMTPGASVEARCALKAPSEPLIRGATGGEVRRSCLSGRSPRVLRRPPVVSSAGESADQAQLEQTTGSAGSPFLVTSLATQRSNPVAGPGPGQRNVNQRKAAGLHQRTETKAAGPRPGQRCAKQQKAPGPHHRTAHQLLTSHFPLPIPGAHPIIHDK